MEPVIAAKRSKWERDLIRFGSEEVVQKLYKLQKTDIELVRGSHERQKQGLALLQAGIRGAKTVYREELPYLTLAPESLIISYGGDNHFIHVARFAENHAIAGVNSDDKTSSGALLQFTPKSFIEWWEKKFDNASFVYDYWSRLEGVISYPDSDTSVSTSTAVSEVSIRNRLAENMSRYRVRIDNEPFEEQKSSGLLLATGAGSTGWFLNCLPQESLHLSGFDRCADFFRFVARESGYLKTLKYRTATVEQKSAIEILSEMDGVITFDAGESSYEFPPGAQARFFISRTKLKVLKK